MSSDTPHRVSRLKDRAIEIAPGLLLCLVLAVVAYLAAHWPLLADHLALSPLTIGIVLGMVLRLCLTLPERCAPGLAWTMHYLLRAGIILLGFRLMLPELLSVGASGLLLVVLATLSTLVLGIGLGRLLGISPRLSVLLGCGTGVCGASAIVAVEGVVSARQEEIACAIALVTVFGLIAMFGYPAAAHALGLGTTGYAIWAGTSIHEVAQAVAAGFAYGDQAGATTTLYKLARVALLAPVCAGLALWWQARREAKRDENVRSGPPVPWFVMAFVLVVAGNSALSLPPAVLDLIHRTDGALLTAAMVATGLRTSPGAIASLGVRPVLLAGIISVWISALALGGALWLGS